MQSAFEKITQMLPGRNLAILFLPGTGLRIKFRYWLRNCNFFVQEGNAQVFEQEDVKKIRVIVCDSTRMEQLLDIARAQGARQVYKNIIVYTIGVEQPLLSVMLSKIFFNVRQLRNEITEHELLEQLETDLHVEAA
jgi:hypothetical protein